MLKLFVDVDNTIAVMELVPFTGHFSARQMKSHNQLLMIPTRADFTKLTTWPVRVVSDTNNQVKLLLDILWHYHPSSSVGLQFVQASHH